MFDVALESRLKSDTAHALSILGQVIERAVKRACEEGAAEARTKHGYKDRTGALTRSIKGEILGYSPSMPIRAWGEIWTKSPYAKYVEEGTRPHDIRPKEGHGFTGPLKAGQSRRVKTDVGTHRVALRWFSGGQAHFAAVVHHPGSRPYGFFGLAYRKAEAVAVQEISASASQAQKAFGT